MYNVPQHIDNNKIFIVQRSEIEGRIDPHYNKPEYIELYSLLKSLKCNLSTLKEESYAIFSGITPKSGGDAYSSEADAIPFVRSGDFSDTNTIDFSKLLYLKPEVHNGIMSASQLKKNDLLIAIVGATIGKVGIYLYDRDANINQAICGVRLKEYINPLFVQAFYQTSIGQKIIERTKRPVARANLNLEEVGQFPIPIVDKIIQEKIIGIFQKGIDNKKQKEYEAQQLLDSIDTYILNELGINLPGIRTDIKSRMFLVNRSELEERLDPTVYKDGIKLISKNYNNVKLSSVASVNPTGTFKGKDIETPISFIPMESIDEVYSEVSKLEITTIENASGFTKFKEGDLLWAKITPCMQNGKSAIAKNLTNGLGCGSTEFFVMRPKDERLIIEYLHVILHMKCVRETAMLYFGGSAGQQRVSSAFLENFNLPLPPKGKQIEIVNHVCAMRQRAKVLQEEGKTILENAKKEVEQMILS